MIYECTDCKHCATFAMGWRVLCCNADIPTATIDSYHPVGTGDAYYCKGFDDTFSAVMFAMKDWGGDNEECETYDQMRAWVMQNARWIRLRGPKRADEARANAE